MPSVAPRAALPPQRPGDRRSSGSRRSGGAGGSSRPQPPPNAAPPRTLLFCKPYDVLCSFTDEAGGNAPRATLKGALYRGFSLDRRHATLLTR